MSYENSPCLSCKRVKYPHDCENKQCPPWRIWFLRSWEQLRKVYGVKREEGASSDPCRICPFLKESCKSPCKRRLDWEESVGGNV